jgi:hypothetical protein
VTITLPDIEGVKTYFEFVLERLQVDMQKRISNKYGKKVVVAFTTHTDYFDADQRTFVCKPVMIGEGENAHAAVPAIALSSMNWSWNRVVSANSFTYTEHTFEDCLGAMVDGYKRGNPIEILDVSFQVTLYEEQPQRLLRLQRLFFQYLDVCPYLFIPLNFDRQGVPDDRVLNELKRQWFAFPVQELSVPGFFVKQGIPIDGPVFSTNVRANVDNLYVANSMLLVEDVPAPDGVDQGNYELFNGAEVTIFAVKEDESLEDNQDRVHSTAELGEFKECNE